MIQMFLFGAVVVGITIVIHGLGTALLLDHIRRSSFAKIGTHRLRDSLIILSGAGIALIVVHAIQITVWAIVYYGIAHVRELPTFEDAVYFSTVTFTTLGYGDITLSSQWRLLSGIEAMNGTLLFGWSAALLFILVQKLWTAPGSDKAKSR